MLQKQAAFIGNIMCHNVGACLSAMWLIVIKILQYAHFLNLNQRVYSTQIDFSEVLTV